MTPAPADMADTAVKPVVMPVVTDVMVERFKAALATFQAALDEVEAAGLVVNLDVRQFDVTSFGEAPRSVTKLSMTAMSPVLRVAAW